ncbi:MAG: Bacterial flagellin N-terminal helical region [Phormidesmis priestleyi Ana]|uniref:Bacterial flagellin N-terminal helical region n=1 Tax=Phormidesmis priestleyi Ana TaxID=1666911 RepID=A0A0N8KMC9_9CYAN|nr:MAG: Bacterial flagellin N-terminal helical region [Phormidesmis priestleyi Ana]
MARQKKASTAILAKAQQRLIGMKAIDPKLDLGNGLTTVSFEREIGNMRQKIAAYHMLLAQADAASNELEELDKRLAEMTGRVLAGVAAQYGRASSEYEKAGGVRLGDRRRRRVPTTEAEMAT